MNQKDLKKIIRDTLRARRRSTHHGSESSNIHAAVLIPIFRDDGEYKLLFTKRTNKVEHHKGQISFPGGAVDKEDGSHQETALREAHEEIGLSREDVEVLGQIDDALTVVTSFIIHPFVGFIPYPYNFKLNSREVNRLIEVPLRFFFGINTPGKKWSFDYDGVTYPTPVYEYRGDVIWGATARIMGNLVDIIGGKLNLPEGGV